MEDYKKISLQELEARALPKVEDRELNGLVCEAKAKSNLAAYTLIGLFTGDILGYMLEFEEKGVPANETYDLCILSFLDAIDIYDAAKNLSFKETFKWCVYSRLMPWMLNMKNAQLEISINANFEKKE